MSLAIQIEDAEMEARMLDSLILAVECAIYNEVNSHTKYKYALLAISRMAHEHKKHMKDLSEQVFEQQRSERRRNPDETIQGKVLAQ